jgi:hypothetical protein
MSRKLIGLEDNEFITDPLNNPFRLQSNNEIALITGERSREIDKLSEIKYKLLQKQVTGMQYIENLASRNLGGRENRASIISAIN